MDADAAASREDESMPSPEVSVIPIVQPNALALEYMRKPSSSSIAMMRDAFKGLLSTSD
jgi:hypothetical protein